MKLDYSVLFEKIALPREGVELFEALEEKRNFDARFASDVSAVLELHGSNLDACETLASELAEKYGIAKCSFLLYIQLCLCEKAYNAYVENGWDIDVFYDSMSDICVRIERNYRIYKSDAVGVDNFKWLAGFIKPELFKIGRLEYAIYKITKDFEFDGVSYHSGDKAMTIHIPAYLKFTHELCHESYRRAREFFDKSLGMKDIPIICNSWMIHPYLQEILPHESSISQFGRDFHIYDTTVDPDAPISWVFGKKEENLDDYPQDTTLQRNLVAWLKKGGTVGRGIGILKY